MHEFSRPFDVLTPLGPAECIGIVWDSDRPEWLCFIHLTGEPWFLPNQLIRRYPWASYPERGSSKFEERHMNKRMRDAVQRYRDAGFI